MALPRCWRSAPDERQKTPADRPQVVARGLRLNREKLILAADGIAARPRNPWNPWTLPSGYALYMAGEVVVRLARPSDARASQR
jgi:hypothetical protein